MGKLRELLSFVIRPWASAGDSTGGWRHFGTDGQNDIAIDETSALAIATYYACIRNIAEDTAKLPFTLLQNDGKKRIRMDDDPLAMLFSTRPNSRMTAYTFRTTMLHWAAGWGTGYAAIRLNGAGRVGELNPVHPSRVVPIRLKSGDMNYKVFADDGTFTLIPESNMFVLPGMSADGRTGYSVLKLMQNTLGLASVVQRFAKNFYMNSGRPAGILETATTLKPEARKNLADSWMAMYSGPTNAGKTAVLEAGVQYKAISIPMKDMEFIELRRFQKEEIASWFRMPLYKLQDIGRAQGWSTLDAQETDYVSSCLMPWILRFEQEIRRQLMDPYGYDDNINPHCEFKGLLRGDVAARREFCKAMVTSGAMTPNEWRSYEDMDPSDDPASDKFYIQSAMIPLDKAGAQPASGAVKGDAAPDEPTPTDSGLPRACAIGVHSLDGSK